MKGLHVLPVLSNLPERLAGGEVRCMIEDRHGRLWMGLQNGLYRYDPTTHQVLVLQNQPGNPNSLVNNDIWSLLEDRDGAIWIGTINGLQKLDPARLTFKTYGKAEGLQQQGVRCMLQSRDGKMWIGTFGGLHELDAARDEIRLLTFLSGDYAFITTCLFEDRQGWIWAGAYSMGVFRLHPDSGRWSLFSHDRKNPRSLSNNLVWDIEEDEKGRIWLATGAGLNLLQPHPTHLDSSNFRHWRLYKSSLPDERLGTLVSDGQGHLWLGSFTGLARFDPPTGRVTPYQLTEPVSKLTIFAHRGQNGRLYFADAHNLYHFHPDSLEPRTSLPPVYITGLQLNNRALAIRGTWGDSLNRPSPLLQSVLYTRELDLKYAQNDLMFEFVALNYVRPENNRYRYQLVGQDTGWIETTSALRHARYTNLRPGRYTFRVTGANHLGVWNPEGKSIRLRIRPPIWATWWAYVLYGSATIALFFFLRRYELRRQFVRAEAQRLRELDAVKTNLYTSISHEFRTPLTIILGWAHDIAADPRRRLGEGLQAIRQSGEDLLRLVNQSLDLARLEAGKWELRPERGEVIAHLRSVSEAFHVLAARKNVRLDFITELEALEVAYDAKALQHILSNLLSNAVKFTPEQGAVTVSVGLQPAVPALLAVPGEEWLAIAVADNGIGISADRREEIFNPFYRGDDSLIRRADGVGIGLTVTRQLVQLLNGSISVRSAPGEGSTFTVLLPISDAVALHGQTRSFRLTDSLPPANGERRRPAPNKPARRTNRPRILLIEDNPGVTRYLASCLERDYEVLTAPDGEAGVELALNAIPNLVVTDVMMPKRDGFEVLELLKNDERTSHIPIVVLTALADERSLLTGLRRGANAYLSKPFSREQLLAQVEQLLAERRRLQSYYCSLTRGGGSLQREPAAALEDLDNAFSLRLREVINTHLEDTSFTVEKLAGQLLMTDDTLLRKTRALTGKTPQELIRSLRLTKAEELLRTTQLPVTHITFETGFSSPGYFARAFKVEFGLSPSEYRLRWSV